MIQRNVIVELGLYEKTVAIIRLERLFDPRDIANRLNSDDEAKQKMGDYRIKPMDVRIFKDYLEKSTGRAIDIIVSKNKDAKELVTMVHERTQALVENMDRINTIFQTLLEDIPKLRDVAMAAGNAKENPYPYKEIKTALDVVKTGMDVIASLKNDDEIKRFIRAGILNVNNGMTLEEVLDLVIRLGLELGKNKDEVMVAFARARSKPTPRIIDIN